MPSKELLIWANEEGMSLTQWSLMKLGLWESKGIKGRRANQARAHIHALAIQRGISNQSALGPEDWTSIVQRCVSSCLQLRHLGDQIRRWVEGDNVIKDISKVCIEYTITSS